mmetsp:Transcript_5356/g.16378  ORF Transcript_5356/g.16378 Transcript_5356/m.16378 type:complete len:248 (-) Transcript_5356:576-1319(-)
MPSHTPLLFLLLSMLSRSGALSFAIHSPASHAVRHAAVRLLDEQKADEKPNESLPPPPPASYDLKQVSDKQRAGGGAGFNVGLVDPIASATGFVSRRFGLAGGLAIVALLAATEGREIVGALLDKGPVQGDGKLVTTQSGLQYADLLIGSGDVPIPGAIIGLDAVVSIGGKVLYDTKTDKRLAFKYGQRPFQSVICEGVEEGLKGMRPGGKRKLLVPKALAPKGVDLPDGVTLEYEIELLEVLPNYF